MNRRNKNSVNGILIMAVLAIAICVIGILVLVLRKPNDNGVNIADNTTEEQTFENTTTQTEVTTNVADNGEATEEASEPLSTLVENVPSPEMREPFDINIIAVGDNLVHKEIDDTVIDENGKYDFHNIYSDVKNVIQSADIAILNQEVPCAGNQYQITGYPCFNAPTDVLDAAIDTGFNVLTLATNHALDKDELGLVNTLNYLHTNHPEVLTTGTNATYEESLVIPIKEVKGVKIAILNYTYGTNGFPLPHEYSVNMLTDEMKIRNDIIRAKQEADFVIVCPHWGTEYQLTPNDEQRVMAQIMADSGADLIIGTHPHVVQPLEEVVSADGRVVPVYYSLGNFICAQAQIPRSLGGMARVTLNVDATGNVSVKNTDYDFTVNYFTAKDFKFTSFKVYMARSFPMDLIPSYGIYLWESTFSWQDYLSVIKSLNPNWQ